MNEILEIRINYDYANLLFESDDGKNVGTSVRIVELSTKDPRCAQIPIIDHELKLKYGKRFFFGWRIKRKYNSKELDAAELLHLKFNTVFDPSGEECGTLYDELYACEICGANRKQVGPLVLKKGTIPLKDVAKTISGEIVVSQKFVDVTLFCGLRGIAFQPIYYSQMVSEYYQLICTTQINLSPKTVVGINPFDLSTCNEGEIYKCPNGDTIGLNLLSEPYVTKENWTMGYDFLFSKQKIGVKRGFLRPEPIYFCSPTFKKIIVKERITGFEFERANV